MSTPLVECLLESLLIIAVTVGVTIASYVVLCIGAALFVYYITPPRKEPPAPPPRYPYWGP